MNSPEGSVRVYSSFDEERFPTIDEAVEYVAQYPITPWNIEAPLEAYLAGELIDVDGVESLKLASPYKTGIVPRYYSGKNESGVSVSTAPAPYLDIITFVGNYTDTTFDRGVVWVRVSPAPGDVANLRIRVLEEHGLPAGELTASVREVGKKATTFCMALLDGDPHPPYSH